MLPSATADGIQTLRSVIRKRKITFSLHNLLQWKLYLLYTVGIGQATVRGTTTDMT